MPSAHFKTYVIEHAAKQRLVVVPSQWSRVNVMQDYSERSCQMGKKATKNGRKDPSHSLRASAQRNLSQTSGRLLLLHNDSAGDPRPARRILCRGIGQVFV